MSLDVMKQALEALENAVLEWRSEMEFRSCIDVANTWAEAAEVLRAAIEQALEPVAWMNPSWIDPDTRGWASDSFESIQIEGWIPLYTAPRQWQGLTDEEIAEIAATPAAIPGRYVHSFARAIEARLKEKNT